jgi:hypothetical protein
MFRVQADKITESLNAQGYVAQVLSADDAPPAPPDPLQFFREQGALGGKIGGVVRAERMTQEQRSESARKAVSARWERAKAKAATA